MATVLTLKSRLELDKISDAFYPECVRVWMGMSSCVVVTSAPSGCRVQTATCQELGGLSASKFCGENGTYSWKISLEDSRLDR